MEGFESIHLFYYYYLIYVWCWLNEIKLSRNKFCFFPILFSFSPAAAPLAVVSEKIK